MTIQQFQHFKDVQIRTFRLLSCGGLGSFSGVLGRIIKYWLPLVLWMGVIFCASADAESSKHSSHFLKPIILWFFPHISTEALEMLHYFGRKMGHVSEYAMLGVLYWRLLRNEPRLIGSRGLARQYLLVVMLCCLFAATDEFHQLFVPSREGLVSDVMIDTVGSSFGALAYLGVFSLFRKK